MHCRYAHGCLDLYKDVFFLKHCMVREWIARQVEGYVAVILDVDNVAAGARLLCPVRRT